MSNESKHVNETFRSNDNEVAELKTYEYKHYTHPDRQYSIKNRNKTLGSNNAEYPSKEKKTKQEHHEEIINDADIPEWLIHESEKGKEKPANYEPPDDDDGDDSEDGHTIKNYDNKHKNRIGRGLRDDLHRLDNHGRKGGLGINGLMRAFVGKPTFTGNWDEDLDNSIKVFNTIASMCEVTEDEKVKSIPIMLSGDALNYYSVNVKQTDDFDSAMKWLRSWYNNDDKKSIILGRDKQ